MISAKRLDVPFSINKENILLPLVNAKRLRGKIFFSALSRNSEALDRGESAKPSTAFAKPEISKQTGTSTSGQDNRPPCYSYNKESCLKDNKCDNWHPLVCVFHTKVSAERA